MNSLDEEQELDRPHNPLGDWLQSLSSAGEVKSEGSGFSIAQEKAWEKLGAFQLPFESAWVLKVVQAAVVGGALSIEVVQTRSETHFTLSSLTGVTWNSVQKLLFEVDSASESASSHLAVAFRTLAKSVGNPFLVNFPGDSVVVWDGSAFQAAEPTSDIFEIKISHFLSTGVFKAIRFMTGIQKALCDYCHLCPIPLNIDNRAINSLVDDPLCRPSADCSLLAFQTAKISEDLPRLKLPSTDWNALHPDGARPSLDFESAFRESDEECGAGMLLCGFRKVIHGGEQYFRSYRKPSELIWLRHGVIVARESLNIAQSVALLLIVNAEGLDTDLTGFDLRKNDGKMSRRNAAIRAAFSALKELKSRSRVKLQGRNSFMSLLGWGGIALTVLIPPAGLALWGLRASALREDQERIAKEFDNGLSRVFANLR